MEPVATNKCADFPGMTSSHTISKKRLLTDPAAVEKIEVRYRKSDLDPVAFYDSIKAEFPQKADRRAIKQMLKECVRDPSTCEVFALDIRDYASKIEPDSVDWIITDPPYPDEYLKLYDVLSELGAYALRPGGGMLVMCGQSYLPEVLTRLTTHLAYRWTLAYLTTGGQSWKPIVLLSKGKYKGLGFGDVIKTSSNNNDKSHHYWGQSVEGMDDLVRRFTFPGQVVLDPFLGGGTTAIAALRNHCSFVGFDLDSQCVETTRKRIANEGFVG